MSISKSVIAKYEVICRKLNLYFSTICFTPGKMGFAMVAFIWLTFFINPSAKGAILSDTAISEKPSWIIGAKYYGGYTFSPYERVRNLEAHTWDAELLISKATYGTESWQAFHAYPRIGLAIDYIDLGKKITGQVLAVIPHLQWNFMNAKNTQIALRFGVGIGYLNTIFNVKDNYKNKAISTPLNACLQLNAVFTQKLSKNMEMNAGIGMTHFSNGSWRIPNNGLNIPGIFLGTNYIINKPQRFYDATTEAYKEIKQTYCYIYSAISSETSGYLSDHHYTIYSLSAVYGKRVSRRSKLGIGMDIFYDVTTIVDSFGHPTNYTHFSDPLQAGIKIEHELVMGKLGLITNFGAYIYHESKLNPPVYQIIGLKYNFTPRFFAGSFLKTHFARADFAQWAVGYSF